MSPGAFLNQALYVAAVTVIGVYMVVVLSLVSPDRPGAAPPRRDQHIASAAAIASASVPKPGTS